MSEVLAHSEDAIGQYEAPPTEGGASYVLKDDAVAD
jgi:hypothetical protein